MIFLKDCFSFLQSLISYYLPIVLLVICGILITLNGKFFQFRKFPESLKLIVKAITTKHPKNSKLTSLQSASTALAATVGTGNIAGVAGAVSIGGAGAIFWMWISAFLCMAIKYAEITLAVLFREKKGNEEYVGGPMYYIKNKLPKPLKPLGFCFALAGIPATFCTGNITQSNAAILTVSSNLNVRLILGIIFCSLTYLVVFGGADRIGKVTEKIVPIMSVIYAILAFGIIICNFSYLPYAFKMIVVGAFNPKAVTGGIVGSMFGCVISGVSKGVFSNEAGLGSSAMAHSIAYDATADTQGLFGIFEVFIDTVVICTLTGLTILCSGVNITYGSIASANLVGEAFFVNYGNFSKLLLSVMMCFFGFSSIIGWAVYGNICSFYLFGQKGKKIFLLLYPLGCIIGAVSGVDFAWKISEFFNGIMLTVNLPSILLLSDDFLNVLRGKRNVKCKNRKFEKYIKSG